MEKETEIQRKKQKQTNHQKKKKTSGKEDWEGLEREDGEQTAAER